MSSSSGRRAARRDGRSLERLLEQDLIRVTEQAAIAAAHTMGRGDRKHADRVAVEAMRRDARHGARSPAAS